MARRGCPLLATLQLFSTRQVGGDPCSSRRIEFSSTRQVWGLPVLVALIFDATRRVSTLLVTSFTHFRRGKEGETLVVTLKPNPPNPGHGYGFRAGDFHSTRTRTCPTHTRLPTRVRKPVTGPTAVSCWRRQQSRLNIDQQEKTR